jgi:hypothetical protein
MVTTRMISIIPIGNLKDGAFSPSCWGTFFLMLVAAGAGIMGQAFPDTISRTAAVVAPGLMGSESSCSWARSPARI